MYGSNLADLYAKKRILLYIDTHDDKGTIKHNEWWEDIYQGCSRGFMSIAALRINLDQSLLHFMELVFGAAMLANIFISLWKVRAVKH